MGTGSGLRERHTLQAEKKLQRKGLHWGWHVLGLHLNETCLDRWAEALTC